jgi:Tol biopolymer transport system component
MLTGLPPIAISGLIDLERGVSSRLTFDAAEESNPLWSPDNKRIAFLSGGADRSGIRVKSASGIGPDEPLLTTSPSNPAFLDDWSADGRFLVYDTPTNGTAAMDLWVLPLTGERKPIPIVQGPGVQNRAVISPDNRWIAYTSTNRELHRFTSNRFLSQPRDTRYQKAAAHNRNGAATARRFSF